MTGQIIYTPESPHSCSGYPDPKTLRRGTIWQCDDCNTKWVVVVGAQYNEPYSAWRKLNNRNKSGEDLF